MVLIVQVEGLKLAAFCEEGRQVFVVGGRAAVGRRVVGVAATHQDLALQFETEARLT